MVYPGFKMPGPAPLTVLQHHRRAGDFIASGRTGRRNALHDILQSPSDQEGRELPLTLSLSQLHINAGGGDGEDAEESQGSSSSAQREAEQRNS